MPRRSTGRSVTAWLAQAREDAHAAKILLKAGAYTWAAFAYQQYLEKLLKAAYAQRFRDTPPNVHNLLHLARSLRARALTKPMRTMLTHFSNLYAVSLYPNAQSVPSVTQRREADRIRKEAEILAEWIQDEFDL